jgi:hypothetical protein
MHTSVTVRMTEIWRGGQWDRRGEAKEKRKRSSQGKRRDTEHARADNSHNTSKQHISTLLPFHCHVQVSSDGHCDVAGPQRSLSFSQAGLFLQLRDVSPACAAHSRYTPSPSCLLSYGSVRLTCSTCVKGDKQSESKKTKEAENPGRQTQTAQGSTKTEGGAENR